MAEEGKIPNKMTSRIQQRENRKKKALAKAQKTDDDNVVFVGRAISKQAMNRVKKTFTQFGKVEKIWFRSLVGYNEKKSLALQRKFKKEGREKTLMLGNFHIRYQSKEDAERAVQEMNMKEVEWHDDRLHVTLAEQKKYTKNAVHLRNLPPTATEKSVYEAFDGMGISGVRIFRDTETGDCLGTGFIEFDTTEACDLVLQKKSVKIDGKPVYIHKMLKKKQLAEQKAKKMIELQKKESTKKRLGNVIITKTKKTIGNLKKKKISKHSKWCVQKLMGTNVSFSCSDQAPIDYLFNVDDIESQCQGSYGPNNFAQASCYCRQHSYCNKAATLSIPYVLLPLLIIQVING